MGIRGDLPLLTPSQSGIPVGTHPSPNRGISGAPPRGRTPATPSRSPQRDPAVASPPPLPGPGGSPRMAPRRRKRGAQQPAAAEAPEEAGAPQKRARAEGESSPGGTGPRVVIEHW